MPGPCGSADAAGAPAGAAGAPAGAVDAPPRRRGRKRRTAVAAESVVGGKYVALLQNHLDHLAKAYDHGNRVLFYDDVLAAYLLAFFNPTLRSQRAIDDFSATPAGQEVLGVDRVARSTFSDASHLFDADLLAPLVADLRQRVPHLKGQDPRLHGVLKSVGRIVAGDGSLFAIAAKAAWALRRTDRAGEDDTQVRLNLQLDVLSGLPEGPVSISGMADGSESGAFAKLLAPGNLYVNDRGFVDFAYVKAVLAAGSHLLLRLKGNTAFRVCQELPLTDEDRAAGVVADRLGYLGVEGGEGPADVLMREVVVLDPKTGDRVRLLTTLTDPARVPAHVVGLVYRYRWQIELFFRWLKVWADWEHLVCQSENGVKMHFYVALIGTLLVHIRTGRKLSKYGYYCLCWVAQGHATLADIAPVLERRERERRLERERLARKKQTAAAGQKTQA